MKTDEMNKLLELMFPAENIELSEIPQLDLYMDQVIQIFENKFSSSLRNAKEKVLTKTMINNYSKDKLLMPSRNKKYSPSHMILLSLIYQLKGSLTISDIKTVLTPILEQLDKAGSYGVEQLYGSYLQQYKADSNAFMETITKRMEELTKAPSDSGDSMGSYESNLLILLSFVTMSNLYRKAGELLIDQFLSQEQTTT